jgi:hypothetical protein
MLLATTSYFSLEVQKYKASRYDLALRDYEGIVEWLNTYRPNPGGRLSPKIHKRCRSFPVGRIANPSLAEWNENCHAAAVGHRDAGGDHGLHRGHG